MKMNPKILGREFYNQPTLKVAEELLGKYIIREAGGKRMVGRIVETEAYKGPDDLASHASRGRTARTEIMFGPAGVAYVYLIYGMHFCFNIITEEAGYPAAVLIRAVEPVEGIEEMMKNRKGAEKKNLTNGPGKFCQAFQIDKKINGLDLTLGKELWLTEGSEKIKKAGIVAAKRVGVDYAQSYKDKHWRFYIKGNGWVSKI